MVPPWMFGIMKSLTVLRPKLVLYTTRRAKAVLDNVVLQDYRFYIVFYNIYGKNERGMVTAVIFYNSGLDYNNLS